MSEKSIKLAHFSDMHIAGKQDRRQQGYLEKLLTAIVKDGCGHIVITGDLVNSTNPSDWQIIKDILRKKGLYAWDKVTLIPGNHDLINLEEEARLYNALNPVVDGRKKRFRRKMLEFCRFFKELITGEEEVAGFPFIKVLKYGDITVSLVMVNTISHWMNIDNPLGARGYVNPGELKALSDSSVKEAIKGSFVIGVFHHAYKIYGSDSLIDQAFDWTMELKNRQDLLQAMKKLNAELLLHGHFHRFQTYKAGGIQIVNGGSFSYNPRRYNEVTISGERSYTQRFVDI